MYTTPNFKRIQESEFSSLSAFQAEKIREQVTLGLPITESATVPKAGQRYDSPGP